MLLRRTPLQSVLLLTVAYASVVALYYCRGHVAVVLSLMLRPTPKLVRGGGGGGIVAHGLNKREGKQGVGQWECEAWWHGGTIDIELVEGPSSTSSFTTLGATKVHHYNLGAWVV